MPDGTPWPKFTVVTPSYNQARFLEATIDSVLSQQYPQLEYIIVDGGSIDGSVDIIRRYQSHLHYWCSEPDGGLYAAINKGFAHSSGEIMSWLNSDDMYCKWTLKTVASVMSSLPNIEWLTSLQPGFWDWHGFCLGFGSIPGYSRDAFLDGRYLPLSDSRFIGWIQQESTFWRRRLWEKAGGAVRAKYNFAGDFNLWSRFYAHAELYAVACPLAGYRFQNAQKSLQLDKYLEEASESLSEARRVQDWSPDPFKAAIGRLRLLRVPGLRSVVKRTHGYRGRKVVRDHVYSPDSSWRIEEYRFV